MKKFNLKVNVKRLGLVLLVILVVISTITVVSCNKKQDKKLEEKKAMVEVAENIFDSRMQELEKTKNEAKEESAPEVKTFELKLEKIYRNDQGEVTFKLIHEIYDDEVLIDEEKISINGAIAGQLKVTTKGRTINVVLDSLYDSRQNLEVYSLILEEGFVIANESVSEKIELEGLEVPEDPFYLNISGYISKYDEVAKVNIKYFNVYASNYSLQEIFEDQFDLQKASVKTLENGIDADIELSIEEYKKLKGIVTASVSSEFNVEGKILTVVEEKEVKIN